MVYVFQDKTLKGKTRHYLTSLAGKLCFAKPSNQTVAFDLAVPGTE